MMTQLLTSLMRCSGSTDVSSDVTNDVTLTTIAR